MLFPWANVILFLLLLAQIVTGYFGLVNGRESFNWILWLHGIGAYALVVLLYWKSSIIFDALRRKNKWTKARFGFAFMAILLLVVIGMGIIWSAYGPIYWLGFSLVSLHIYLAVPLMLLMAWHAWKMRFVLRLPATLGRQLFVKSAATSMMGLFSWVVIGQGKEWLEIPGAGRRFTGSYERGSFSGRFPVVSWIFDFPKQIDTDEWRLTIKGAVSQPLTLDYAQLRQLATEERTALLDCTGGWYTEQVWRGISVASLLERVGLDASAKSITFRAVSGYQRRFSTAEAQNYLLALAVAGRPLSHGHGAPLRLVAPGKRGVEWVKWISEIEVNTTSKYWQSPLPLQ